MKKYIEINNLIRTYQPSSKVKVNALRGVNFDIKQGQALGSLPYSTYSED
jgi:ABC-type dipeptide/oligopeptide/nickel transport system ATPase subunit